MKRVLVIGKGMAGTAAALAARARGAEVTVVGVAPGATGFCGGLAWPEPGVGAPDVPAPLQSLLAICPIGGRYADCWGELREGLLAQPEQAAGVLDPHSQGRNFAVVSLRGAPQLLDAEGVASALRTRGLKAQAREIDLSLRAREARRSAFEWAVALDSTAELDRFAGALARIARGDDLLLLPPIVGFKAETIVKLGGRLRGRLAELAATQPSVPGLRLARALEAALDRAGCGIVAGSASSLEQGKARISSDAGDEELRFDAAILATGRYLGGGVRRQGAFSETVANLPLALASGRPIDSNEPIERLVGDGPGASAPAFELGVAVDWQLHPIGWDGRALPWLWAAGSIIAGPERGLAFAMRTGTTAGESAALESEARAGGQAA